MQKMLPGAKDNPCQTRLQRFPHHCTAITRGFHICSHQIIGDHCKKKKPNREHTTNKKGIS